MKLLEYRVSLITTLMLAVSLVIPASAAAADTPTLVDVRAAGREMERAEQAFAGMGSVRSVYCAGQARIKPRLM